MRYLLVDTANTFFRARHSAHRQSDTWDKLGFAIHVTLASINKSWRDQKADHVIFCLEGRSWRKDFYEPYKKNRSVARAALTESEAEEDKLFWETFDKFKDFVTTKTNCTVLQNSRLEADDLIAGFIQGHPDDDHVIISTDSDFAQLISPKVKQYNGVADTLTTHEGIFDKKGKIVIDNKTKKPKAVPNPAWLLFEKCIRGDTSDNVFSAYPGVRKTKMQEAFEDRNQKGFAWNNLMLQRWLDHEGKEHRVLDDYERNKKLIDLTQQPDDIRNVIVETITNQTTQPKNIDQVGIRLLKFCNFYDLQRVADNIQQYAEPFQAKYNK